MTASAARGERCINNSGNCTASTESTENLTGIVSRWLEDTVLVTSCRNHGTQRFRKVRKIKVKEKKKQKNQLLLMKRVHGVNTEQSINVYHLFTAIIKARALIKGMTRHSIAGGIAVGKVIQRKIYRPSIQLDELSDVSLGCLIT